LFRTVKATRDHLSWLFAPKANTHNRNITVSARWIAERNM
jgi:hypothetical protein